MRSVRSSPAENDLLEQGLVAGPTRVTFLSGERRAVERTARRLFGRTVHAHQYASLAGGPAGAEVELGTLDGALYIETREPVTTCFYGVQLVRPGPGGPLPAPGPLLVNDVFRIAGETMRRRGLGLRIFSRQLLAAKSLGIRRIETTAGRRENENGYYTWPRFGFDGPLPPDVRAALPPGLGGAQTVLDLMQSHAGRLWWREYGISLEVVFDLGDGSRSRKAFGRYVHEKASQSLTTKDQAFASSESWLKLAPARSGASAL